MKKSIAMLAALTAAATCLIFSACGGGPADNGEKSDLSADTDFSALISDRVTEEEWKAAFSEENLSDFTMRYRATKDGDSSEILYRSTVAGGDKVIEGKVTEQNADGTLHYSNAFFIRIASDGKWYQYGQQDDEWMVTEVDPEASGAAWYATYTCVCPDFSDFYHSFSYSETSGAYELAVESVEMPSAIEFGTGIYHAASVKIKDGKPFRVGGTGEIRAV